MIRSTISTLAGAAVLALAGCSTPPLPAADAALATPARWQAPLPHQGEPQRLALWWQQFDDPALPALIDAAQAASPTVASAVSRIEQARAAAVGASATLLPSLSAGASLVRGRQDLVTPLSTVAAASVQAAWELDVFGANRAARDAAQARLLGARATWHEARVSVAAEVAGTYNTLRACEAQLVPTQADVASRSETARLTELSAKAGFQAPANAALARAGAAQGRSLLAAQQAQCELLVKALVALTGWQEPVLRQQLTAGAARLPKPAQLLVDQVPAQVLTQRPDLYSAERDVVAAAADAAQAQAQRYPRISLAGSIGHSRIDVAGTTDSGTVWALGPLQVSLPLFDGGARAANVDAARARYDEAAAVYRGRLRTAVREVEEALVNLQSTALRNDDARTALQGYEESLSAAQARFDRGVGSLFELEDARRTALQAQSSVIDLQRERVAAWISLYRALGGGWSAEPVLN